MATADTSIERPLPHNLEAERSILGAVLLDNHSLNAAVEKLRSEDFFLPQHRQIFQRMIQLAEHQQAIDVVTLMDDLARRGELDSAGGVAYLSQLADGLPRAHQRRALRAHRQRKGRLPSWFFPPRPFRNRRSQRATMPTSFSIALNP